MRQGQTDLLRLSHALSDSPKVDDRIGLEFGVCRITKRGTISKGVGDGCIWGVNSEECPKCWAG